MWEYFHAVVRGDPQNLKVGDGVVVILLNLDDPENVLTESRVYGWDEKDGFSQAEFIAMVKRETANRLAELNKLPATVDATTAFKP